MIRYLIFAIGFLTFSISPISAQPGWQQVPSPVDDDLHKIFFTNDSTGWIITHQTGRVLHTDNAGKTWRVQAEFDSLYLESIHFINDKVGWISGQYGQIFKTENGGSTWKKKEIAGDRSWIYTVYFHNEKEGIAVGLQEGPLPFKPVFMRTADGGTTWLNLGETVPRTGYEPVAFINQHRGYVAGIARILHTSDGGRTWETQFSDTTSHCNSIRDLFIRESGTVWAVGACGLVMKSPDGKKWTRLKPFTANLLRNITFVNPREGYIAGDANEQAGVLFHTSNGGKTWEKVDIEAPGLHRITLTGEKIWIVGKDGIILARDR